MTRKSGVFGVCVAVSGVIAVVAHYIWPHLPGIFYTFKPLTTILILLMAFSAPNSRYKFWVVIGFVFALMGDIFLMLPSDQFIAGLICFLITHICYISAFLSDSKFGHPLRPYISLAIVVFLIFTSLSHNIESAMRIPVAIYTAALCFMTSQAIARNSQHHSKSSLLAAIGAVLFLISDTLLAYDRFVFVFRFSDAMILSTYYAAQYLIALSANENGRVLDPPLHSRE
jgi:uncharacterized membrane protein YhhN